MLLATSYEHIRKHGLRRARERGVRPAVGFDHPREVLRDPQLSDSDKRSILASWASDASAVQDEPTKRWLLGTPEPVAFVDILDAMAALDRGLGRRPSLATPPLATSRVARSARQRQEGGSECTS